MLTSRSHDADIFQHNITDCPARHAVLQSKGSQLLDIPNHLKRDLVRFKPGLKIECRYGSSALHLLSAGSAKQLFKLFKAVRL